MLDPDDPGLASALEMVWDLIEQRGPVKLRLQDGRAIIDPWETFGKGAWSAHSKRFHNYLQEIGEKTWNPRLKRETYLLDARDIACKLFGEAHPSFSKFTDPNEPWEMK